MADGIVDQVGEDTLDHREVRVHVGQAGRICGLERDRACLARQLEFLQHVLDQVGERELLPLRRDDPVLETGQLEE